MVETKRGNPYSLAIIYAGIAQQLGLPIYGVNLPRNFVLAYKDTQPLEPSSTKKTNNVLFYINPYSKGTVLSYNEIDHYLDQLNIEKKTEYFEPCTNLQTIAKFVEHLITSYKKIKYVDKAM